MSKKFYTADWHCNSQLVNEIYKRPFSSVVEMNERFIANCNEVVSSEDILIHVGDFCCYSGDGGFPGLKVNPQSFIDRINPTFVNIEGNHDPTNKTKSIAWFMRTHLGNTFPDVSVGHYPSYHPKMKDLMIPGWIHLCGHVHNQWKYFIDRDRQILNINVGVDVWNYYPVSESDLISYIKNLMEKTKKNARN